MLRKKELVKLKRTHTYRQIADMYGVNPGVIFRVCNHPDPAYEEKVGNKARDPEFRPIWEYVDPAVLVYDVPRLTMYYCRLCSVQFDDVIDYIYNRLYSKDFSTIRKRKSFIKLFIKKTVMGVVGTKYKIRRKR